MTLKSFMEIVGYRITEGYEYQWKCFGPKAYALNYWNGDHNGFSVSVIFDTLTSVVYCMEACDYQRSRAYRIINPEFTAAHEQEINTRIIDDLAWDDVHWIDLELMDDFEEKARAIVAGIDYDTRISIPLDLPDDLLLEAALNAHRQGITLNDYIYNALRELLVDFERNPEAVKARARLLKNEE